MSLRIQSLFDCRWLLQAAARPAIFTIVTALLTVFAPRATGQNLQITYGAKGLQTLAYSGVVLEDVALYPNDSFHIWHTKSTDLSGTVDSGWGENNNQESWNPATLTETYTFQWGTIAARFAQQGNTLNVIVTETNYAGSGTNFDGAEVYPFALHFPQDPAGFSGYSQTIITTTGPGVSAADFGQGIVTAVLPDESIPMYVGWKNAGPNTYSPLMTTTSPDGLAPFLLHQDYPVSPGTSFTYTLSFRFTPKGVPADATDAYNSFRTKYPSLMTWTDKRIIGTAYLASSPQSNGNASLPGGFPTNPRRYFNDPSIDITNPSGLRAFQNRMLVQASTNVVTSSALYAQGVVTWDIEGEQYPQATSYVCSPDQIATAAPEMESIITDSNSPYFGKKLVDAYFQTISSAGLRVGVCLRPQVFSIAGYGTAVQTYLPTGSAIVANLENKARYANARWGATIFYVDSTVDIFGGTLDPAVFQQLITDLPAFLFIPEESTPRYYAYSAPFYSFIFHSTIGTPDSIYNLYPQAFGANLINDAEVTKLAASRPQLTQAVSRGDILMGHADYWQANDPTLVDIYRSAGSPPVPPVQALPGILWPEPPPIFFGTPLSAAQLDATANTSGVFTYTPAVGSVLPAGTSNLLATFTPADTRDYKSTTTSVQLQIAKATPVLSWSSPLPVTAGTSLTGLQLNATADVPGTFVYKPALRASLNSGANTLQVIFTPSDRTNYNVASFSVELTVLPQQQTTPTIAWSTPLPITYGTALNAAQLNPTSGTAGSFTYNPAAGTVLSAGTSSLSVTFTPVDTRRYAIVTCSVALTVAKARPVLTWPTPQAVPEGTALNSSQLNATANVAGAFAYTPAAGTVLNAGSTSLQATFTPSDTRDYSTTSISATVTVFPQQRTTSSITWPKPQSIVYGSPLIASQLMQGQASAPSCTARAQGPSLRPEAKP